LIDPFFEGLFVLLITFLFNYIKLRPVSAMSRAFSPVVIAANLFPWPSAKAGMGRGVAPANRLVWK
jgi:hypothetical protein